MRWRFYTSHITVVKNSMSTQAIIGWAVAVIIVIGGGYFLLQSNGTDSMMKEGEDTMIDEGVKEKEDSMMKEEDAMMQKKGSYEEYAPEKLSLGQSGKVILYFHADWCPICRGLEADVHARLPSIPDGVHILKVNYDTATALKQQYGVTYQHTFVQVDARGNQVAKWGDATTLAQVLAKIQ